jgi:hypothetical protein
MKPHFFFWTVSLLTGLVVVSCAPASTPVQQVPTDVLPSATAAPAATLASGVVPTSTVIVQAVATSRGSELEATDPATVNLASGQLQLVEFFRFT